jgi:cytochrome oxidase Cu insertion factor (SCO1/SenC/PrrC family)
MPGMNSGQNPASTILVTAFRSALLRQSVIVALIFLLLFVAWGATKTVLIDGRPGNGGSGPVPPRRQPLWQEPRARRLLRIGFGILWLFDGILQAQPQMAGGLASQVIQPSADGSPSWVAHLVNWSANLWSYHPVAAAASSVWIQVGIGLWMIFAVRGWSVRLAALSGVAWGLIVWAFGESFGAIFAPGLTVLFGAPGAVLLYVVAGALLALPERAWAGPRAGRLILGGSGAFFLGVALLQAWPGRGFWQGTLHGQPGSLAAMIKSMADTSQPHFLEVLVAGFANFTVSHGFAVNLVAVIALALIGAAMTVGALRSDARLALIAVLAATVFCLADWVLVEDLGFLGGLGTDPNNMIPLILLFTVGYLGVAPQPEAVLASGTAASGTAASGTAASGTAGADAPSPRTVSPEADTPMPEDAGVRSGRFSGASELLSRFAVVPVGVIAGLGALGVIIVGAAPMAFATAQSNADPIVAEAIAGTSGTPETPAPNFTLTSQDGRSVALTSLRGKVVLLAFLDPVCTTDCPVIAQEMRLADTLLGSAASATELVAVVANPTYTSLAYTRAFDRQEDLEQVPNWLFLTGSLGQLDAVWHSYGIEVENLPAGAMAAHNDLAFVISAKGVIQQEINDDPGPGTGATTSSFASLLANAVKQSLGGGQ